MKPWLMGVRIVIYATIIILSILMWREVHKTPPDSEDKDVSAEAVPITPDPGK